LFLCLSQLFLSIDLYKFFGYPILYKNNSLFISLLKAKYFIFIGQDPFFRTPVWML